MMRWVPALLLAMTAVLVMPTAAHADEADCADSPYLDGAFETFEVDRMLLPPSMRGGGWDCALRVTGREFDETLLEDGRYSTAINFIVLYVDFGYDEMVEYFRAFERSGYMAPDDINIVATPDGGSQSVRLGSDDLAALDPRPGYVNARFSHPADVPSPGAPGANIYSAIWTDGVEFQSDSGIVGRPQLIVNVIVTTPFLSGTQLDDPSTLSDLRTIGQAAPTGVQWAVIASGSFMLMLVVGWPSTLLNSVVGSRYQQLVRWLRGRFSRRDDASAPAEADRASQLPGVRQSRLPGWLMWPGFALAAILGAFVDADFGFNPMSARLVVTLFLSFLLFNLAAWAIVRRVAVRLQPDSDPYLRFRWGSLALVVLAVVVARILGLEPGVIFGLVAGIAYATTLQAARSAIVTIVGSAFGLVLAIVAWVGYSLLAPQPVDNVAYVFVVEFLAGVTVKGVSTLPLSLLPLGNLEGAKLFGWKKAVWAVAYLVGLAAFMLVLLTIPKSWGEIPGDFLRWLLVFGVYALVAIVVWAVNVRLLKKRPLPPEKEQGDQPDAITID